MTICSIDLQSLNVHSPISSSRSLKITVTTNCLQPHNAKRLIALTDKLDSGVSHILRNTRSLLPVINEVPSGTTASSTPLLAEAGSLDGCMVSRCFETFWRSRQGTKHDGIDSRLELGGVAGLCRPQPLPPAGGRPQRKITPFFSFGGPQFQTSSYVD